MLATEQIKKLNMTWKLERQIYGSFYAHATGEAVWNNHGQYSEYSEKLETNVGGAILESNARFIYHPQGTRLNIYTDTNDHLFEIDLDGNNPEFIASRPHICKNDRYYAYFNFSNTQHLQIVFIVKGPKKNYTSISNYTNPVSHGNE